MSKLLQNRIVVSVFSMVYLGVLIYLLFFAFFRQGTTTRVNFVPFDSMVPLTVYTFKTGHGLLHWFVNVPGNVLAFLPLSLPLNFFIRPRIPKIFFCWSDFFHSVPAGNASIPLSNRVLRCG